MRRMGIETLVGGLVLSLCAGLAAAQEREANPRDRDAARPGGAQAHQVCLASKVMNSQIEDRSGEKIGTLEDLVIDSEGQVRYLALQTSGKASNSAGARERGEKGRERAEQSGKQGQQYVLVPFEAVKISQKKGDQPGQAGQPTLQLQIAADELEKAPKFSQQQLSGQSQQWMAEVDRFFKIERRKSARPELRDRDRERENRPEPKKRDQN